MVDYPDGTLPISIIAYHITSLPVDIIAQTIGNLNIDIKAQTIGDINVNITNATITVTGTVAISGSVTVTGSVTVSGTVSISGTVTVTGSVTVSGTVSISGSVTVTGAVTVSGSVSITGSVTITGAVTITSGAVTITTTGGTNIFIDLLTQTAYLERRSIISNNGTLTSWTYASGTARQGKFFPRGCRGFINTIDVYCKDAGAAGGTITVYISPHPSMGYLYSATVTITASGAAGWRNATFNKMWNYDSIFIWLLSSTNNMQWAIDTSTPYDAFDSSDSGATWAHTDQRRHIRVKMKGETVGDVPVSGVLNTIQIPAVSDERIVWAGSLVDDVTKIIKTIHGSGHVEYIRVTNPAQAGSADTLLLVYTDGNLAFRDNFVGLNDAGHVASTPKISLLQHTTDNRCDMLITIRFEFTRILEVKLLNGTGNQANIVVDGLVNLIT